MGPPRMPRPYELNPELKAALRVESFQGTFSAKAFIEKLSSGIIATRIKENSNTFDPKPFIRTFENSLDELEKLSNKMQKHTIELERETQKEELAFKKQVKELGNGFEGVQTTLESLESRISEVGSTAIRIGEKLETADKQRARAVLSKKLMEYFMQFNEGRCPALESLVTQQGHEGQIEAARILRQLAVLAKEVDLPDTQVAREGIEKFREQFETDMLSSFDKAYRHADPKVMAHCAKALLEFNGGHSCVQIYVNQHDFFMLHSKVNESTPLEGPSQENLTDPVAEIPPIDAGLIKLYDDIRSTVEQEAEIISMVFPNPAAVFQVFIQRVFGQSILQFIETLLERAQAKSTLAYLRTLHSIHEHTIILVEDLKKCEETLKLGINANIKGSNVSMTTPPLSQTLDRCLDDLFVPYLEGNRYLEKELNSLCEIYDSKLEKFTAYQLQRRGGNKFRAIITRTFNQMLDSSNKSIMPVVQENFATVKNPEKYQNMQVADDSGALLMPLVIAMLKIHAESVVRSAGLLPVSGRPKNTAILFQLLTDYIGMRYIDAALDSAIEDLSAHDPKLPPDLGPVKRIKLVNGIIHLLQMHFQTTILPLTVPSPQVYRDTVLQKNKLMANVESKVNTTIQKEIDVILTWLETCLGRQRRSDFKPKDDEVELMATKPCMDCCVFLKKMYETVRNCFDGKNIEMFLMEIGISFYGMLLEHFKKFSISPVGSVLLSQDIAKYQEAVKVWNISSLNERFEMLRELGKVFMVKPENLPSTLNEGYLAQVDIKTLQPYLQMRVDFKTSKIDKLMEKLNLTWGGGSNSNNASQNNNESASGSNTSNPNRLTQLEDMTPSKFMSYSLR
ncbi:Exocyst complex component 5 [Lunasporangiospora selenospora]|uniref:Exocyst complex component 5 n=1 Tax=Lunasporangiospora selenospora TaxID=979761 RepID=A0A9P6KEC6_9FUNG|nr:Exocyst complex component 5 [Lunasporangiospora selenospora]